MIIVENVDEIEPLKPKLKEQADHRSQKQKSFEDDMKSLIADNQTKQQLRDQMFSIKYKSYTGR